MAGLRIERRLLLPRQRAKCWVGVKLGPGAMSATANRPRPRGGSASKCRRTAFAVLRLMTRSRAVAVNRRGAC